MSVFSNYVTSLNRAGTFGGNDEVRRALVTHIAPNYLLRSGMQSRQIIETAVKAAEKKKGERLVRELSMKLSEQKINCEIDIGSDGTAVVKVEKAGCAIQ